MKLAFALDIHHQILISEHDNFKLLLDRYINAPSADNEDKAHKAYKDFISQWELYKTLLDQVPDIDVEV